ncbi:MAG: sulfatase-like hydrolase/transferase, partial [Verrucomicrobiota bacterium]
MSRPHIILIMTDQQRYETIGALGYPHVDTPHLDRLVQEGVAFSQCHVNSPSCCPSRASFFTGHFPHNSGVQRNNDPWPRTWVEDLHGSGYYCVNVGKMHADPYTKMHGFHERFIVENKQRRLAEPLWSGNPHVFDDDWDKALAAHGHARPEKPDYLSWPDAKERQGCFEWKLPEHLHPDVFTGELALRWLEKKPEQMEEPVFLQIGFPGPHGPYDPILRYAEPYLDRDLPLLPVTEAELESQPSTLK